MIERETLTTRRQILDLLRTRGGMTAKSVAKELGITAMGVHRHLVVFEREGLAQAQLVRQKMGRPTYVYTLTEKAQEDLFPRNYSTLATQVLDAVHETQGDPGISNVFAARMEQLMQAYRPRMQGKNLAERVKELAKIQDEAGYMAIWLKADDGFILKEQNCAIYRVACRFQQACQFEIELFRRLLDAEITRVEHQVKGERYCTYLVRERRASTPTPTGDTSTVKRAVKRR
jgi:predicted ArsR family transcriptional regulator